MMSSDFNDVSSSYCSNNYLFSNVEIHDIDLFIHFWETGGETILEILRLPIIIITVFVESPTHFGD